MASSLNNVANLRRVVVGFRGHESCEKPRIADFLTCLVHHFSPNDLSATVNCTISDDMLVLYSPKDRTLFRDGTSFKAEGRLGTDYESVTLHHSPECPVWRLHDFGSPTPITTQQSKGINVGVTVLLESSDSLILMTQRSDNMRTFPRAWVPPGGNLEVGESPLQGALREMEEEAGLALNPSNTFFHLFCLWESVYPPLIALGSPRSHHVVLYFHAKSSETWKELQAKIKLDPEEVKACTWLTRENVKSLCSGPKEEPEHIKQFIVGSDGRIQQAELNIHRMFFNDFWRGKDVFTGSQLALTKWLESKPSSSQVPSKM